MQRSTRSTQWTFGLITLLSSFLLFQVQPIMGKTILPWFGGGPGVWTTAMLFFQLVLLAGYGYAHGLTTRLAERTQALLHLAVLLAATASLPIVPDPSLRGTSSLHPIARVLLVLTSTIFLPYFAISTTGPLLQRWYSLMAPELSPYGLYALSNVGSLAGLVTYPILVEPALDTTAQAWFWSAAFLLFATGTGLCARWFLHHQSAAKEALAPTTPTAVASTVPARSKALWFCLALVPSAMLLATTNELCVDVATVPFLWVVPLAIYLLSFAFCFASRTFYRVGPFSVLWTGLAIAMSADLLEPGGRGLLHELFLLSAALAVCAVICHGELARRRPTPRHLTTFYLMMSAGGAGGGLLIAVAAPTMSHGYVGLPLSMAGCFILLLWVGYESRHQRGQRLPWITGVIGTVASVVVLSTVALLPGGDLPGGKPVARSRNFYGVLHVTDLTDARVLTHGRIWHGIQFKDPARAKEPTLYFAHDSGIGQLLDSYHSAPPLRVGLVGLGVGTLASYGRPHDIYRFYEIDPDVVHMAKQYFTYLSGSAAKIEVVIGDARMSLEHERPNQFDIMVLDAFSSDSVPAHLLTVEAFRLYLRHLKPAGVIALHVSNRYLDLARVVAGAAQRLDLAMRTIHTQGDAKRIVSACIWVLLAHDEASLRLGGLAAERPTSADPVLWTDTQSSLFEVLRR